MDAKSGVQGSFSNDDAFPGLVAHFALEPYFLNLRSAFGSVHEIKYFTSHFYKLQSRLCIQRLFLSSIIYHPDNISNIFQYAIIF
jgi:hypothetical protein